MKQFFYTVIFTISISGAPAQDLMFINTGSNTSSPQIDALGFYNSGYFFAEGGTDSFGNLIPYSMLNVLNFTNDYSGHMAGNFRLDTALYVGDNVRAESIINHGLIETGLVETQAGYTLLSAEKILSDGFLNTSHIGRVQIDGDEVDLSRGGLRGFSISPFVLDQGVNVEDQMTEVKTYIAPNGVTDLSWGSGSNGVINAQDTILNQSNLETGVSPLVEMQSGGFFSVFAGGGYEAFARQFIVDATNEIRQVFLVDLNSFDPNVEITAGYSFDGGVSDIIVEFSMDDIDVTTGLPFTNSIFFNDFAPIADLEDWEIADNAATGSGKPYPYQITHIRPFNYTSGNPTGLDGDFFSQNNLVSQMVTNWTYVAYSADVQRPQFPVLFSAPNGSTANIPRAGVQDPETPGGRISVDADTLDLSNTRFHAENLISLKTRNLIGSYPNGTSALRYSLDLESVQDKLVIENLVPQTVKRLTGTVSSWTGVWTNQWEIYTTDTNGVTTTNLGTINYFATVIDHNMRTVEDVGVQHFRAVNPNRVEINDSFRTINTFEVDAPIFVNRGTLTPLGDDQNFDEDNLINVLEFINEGSFNAFNIVSLARDLERPGVDIADRFQMINNSGSIVATSFALNSVNFENSGLIRSSLGPLSIESDYVNLDGGTIRAVGDIIFDGAEMIAEGSTLSAGLETFDPYHTAQIVFKMTDTLADGGGTTALNNWSSSRGFQMNTKPANGDLLRTVLSMTPRDYAIADFVWAGEDRGDSNTGYVDNAAVMQLSLIGNSFNLFKFKAPVGSGATALYVDILEIQSTGFGNPIVEVDDNFKIYYRTSNLSAASLMAVFGDDYDRIQQVQDQGNGSSESVGAMAASMNYGDSGSETVIGFSLNAAPNASYDIEYTEEIVNPVWLKIETVTNNSSEVRSLEIPIEISEVISQRFYRAVIKE